MNHSYGEDQDQVSVPGFESPNSPEASYDNSYPIHEDDGSPPVVPPHLPRTLLSHPTNVAPLPVPHNVTLNHLYIENTEPRRLVVGFGTTHRFRSKYVTVVLYKPVPRR